MDQIPAQPSNLPQVSPTASLPHPALPDPLPLEQPLEMLKSPLPSVKLDVQDAVEQTPPVGKTQVPPTPPQYNAPSPSASGEVTLPKAAPVERLNPEAPPAPIETIMPKPLAKGSFFKSKLAIGVFAILFVGALVAGVVFLTQKIGKSEPKDISTQSLPIDPTPTVFQPAPTSSATGSVPLTLSLASPKDGQSVTTGMVAVSGTAAPHSVVVFYTETSQDSVESQESGNFQGEINLFPGSNELIIVAINEKGEKKLQTRSVIYEPIESAEALPSAEPAVEVKQQLIQGLITGINDSVVTILLPDQEEIFYDIAQGASAIIKVKGKGVATLNNLELAQKVVIVGTVDDKNNSILAKLIHTTSKSL